MPRLIEWLGSLMFLAALIEFVPNPRKALETIPSVLATNPRMEGGHLSMPKAETKQEAKTKTYKLKEALE